MSDPFPPETFDAATDAPLGEATIDKLNRLAAAVDDVDVQNTTGDLLGHNGTNHVRVPAGTTGQLLSIDPTQAAGLRYIDIAMESLSATDSSISITGTTQNPSIAVDVIGEEQVVGLHADLATKTALPVPTSTQAAAYTTAPGDLVLADISAAGFTATLPPAPPDQTRVAFKITAATPGNWLTVSRGASDTFETPTGPTSWTLSLPGQSLTVQYQAADAVWLIVSNDLPLGQLDARYVATASNSQLVLVPSALIFVPGAATVWLVNLQAAVTGSSIAPPPPVNTSVPLTIVWAQDSAGGHSYAWPTNCRFAGGTAPGDTTANTRTSVTFVWDGTYWLETARAVAVG